MNIKEKFNHYISKKSKLSIASDVIFILLIIALLIPQSRMSLMANANRVKILFMQPSANKVENTVTLKESDYQILFQDLQGEKLNLSSLKGKVIFINFWATWCPPCVAELPSIQKLYNIYKDNSNIAFLVVSDESTDVIQKFVTKKSYNFPVYINQSRIPEIMSFSSIPTTFLISKSGKIIVHEVGAVNWAGDNMKEIMEGLLKE